MPLTRFYHICIGIIFVLLIIYLLFLDSFILAPIARMFNILVLPLTLSGFFYYLFRPIVNLLHHRGHMKRWISVSFLYLVLIGLIALFFYLLWPKLVEQTINFIDNAPIIMDDIEREVDKQAEGDGVVADVVPRSNVLKDNLMEYAQRGSQWAADYLSTFIAMMSKLAIVLGIVPVILFFMLKEGGKFADTLLYPVPRKYKPTAEKALDEIDNALSSFIVSRVVLNVLLGALMYIGFLIIGLPYALLLILVSIVLNFIPYIGAILSAIPILIVAFMESPMMALWALLIIFVAQVVQDDVLTPLIFGKAMKIHPVTIIVLLLLGGDIAGILGMLLSIPLYMVAKITIKHVYELFFAEKVEEKLQ